MTSAWFSAARVIAREHYSHPPPLRVAVEGGGPAGLTFASLLHRKATGHNQLKEAVPMPWKVTLYEGERSADARRVGGSLNLDRKTGFRAIEAAGLFDRFHDFARPQGQEIRVLNHHGDVVLHYAGDATPDDDRYSPEIDRADLNRVLLESLPPDMIQWDHKLSAVRAKGSVYELEFVNGETAEADIVVGADGAWSRVRSFVTDQKPQYPDTDATLLDIRIHDFSARYPELVETVGKGSLYSCGGGNMLVAQRCRGDVVHVMLGVRVPADWRQHELLVEHKHASDCERVSMLAKAFFGDWGEPLRSLVMVAAENVEGKANDGGESTLLAWPLYALPVGVHWPSRRGVTLLGDAAHLMSPCAGEGVNMGMVDAMELAEALARTIETPLTNRHAAAMAAIEGYEREMFKRVEMPAQRAIDNLVTFFTAPEMTAKEITQLFGPR